MSMRLLTIAKIVRPAVECICSLRAMFRRWVITVFIEMNSFSAISLFDMP